MVEILNVPIQPLMLALTTDFALHLRLGHDDKLLELSYDHAG